MSVCVVVLGEKVGEGEGVKDRQMCKFVMEEKKEKNVVINIRKYNKCISGKKKTLIFWNIKFLLLYPTGIIAIHCCCTAVHWDNCVLGPMLYQNQSPTN